MFSLPRRRASLRWARRVARFAPTRGLTTARVRARAGQWSLPVAPFGSALAAFAYYLFGMVPVQVTAAAQLGLDPAQTSSLIFIMWYGGACATLALSARYRQPLAVAWSIPALLHLAALGDQFTFGELAGATLLAGLLVMALGWLGLAGWLLARLPAAILMAVYAGSLLGSLTALVRATVDDGLVAGATVLGYLAGRALRSGLIPPLGMAVLAGGIAIALAQRATLPPLEWIPPTVIAPELRWSTRAFLAVSLPVVLFVLAVGSVRGLSVLALEGYRVPVDRVITLVGLHTVVNACLGGSAATVSADALSIMAGRDAGPKATRHLGTLLAAGLMAVLAIAAGPIKAILRTLPHEYTVTLVGLALVSPLQNALERAFSGTLRLGALVAFGVAATPVALVGLPAVFWALPAGMLTSLLAERGGLRSDRRVPANGRKAPVGASDDDPAAGASPWP